MTVNLPPILPLPWPKTTSVAPKHLSSDPSALHTCPNDLRWPMPPATPVQWPEMTQAAPPTIAAMENLPYDQPPNPRGSLTSSPSHHLAIHFRTLKDSSMPSLLIALLTASIKRPNFYHIWGQFGNFFPPVHVVHARPDWRWRHGSLLGESRLRN